MDIPNKREVRQNSKRTVKYTHKININLSAILCTSVIHISFNANCVLLINDEVHHKVVCTVFDGLLSVYVNIHGIYI